MGTTLVQTVRTVAAVQADRRGVGIASGYRSIEALCWVAVQPLKA